MRWRSSSIVITTARATAVTISILVMLTVTMMALIIRIAIPITSAASRPLTVTFKSTMVVPVARTVAGEIAASRE